jgi:hypothetical protein
MEISGVEDTTDWIELEIAVIQEIRSLFVLTRSKDYGFGKGDDPPKSPFKRGTKTSSGSGSLFLRGLGGSPLQAEPKNRACLASAQVTIPLNPPSKGGLRLALAPAPPFEGGWGDLHSRRSPITHYYHPLCL